MVAAVKFTRKTLPQKEGLGEKLAKKRISLGLDIKDVEKAIRIRSKYLDALENGKYDTLPPDVYVSGFVRNYASFLKLDPEKVLKLYDRERGLAANVSKAKSNTPSTKPLSAPKLVITPKTLTITSIVMVALLIVGYIGWQVFILTSPPKLKVTNPSDNVNIESDSVNVEGITDTGATLFINDVEVGIDQGGTFREKINLQSGVNNIKIKSLNKMGRYSEVSRTIVAKTNNQNQPVATISGIDLKLIIGPKSASVLVEVDGKKVTDKPVVMLAGVSQSYRAANSIKVTTNNGGSVQAVFNNQNIGTLGKDGETVNQEFNKGMQQIK
jgi:cytoskeletal protein RodZ